MQCCFNSCCIHLPQHCFLYSSFHRPAWVKADLLGYKFWENISIQFACVLFYSFYESCEIVGKKNGGLFGKFLHYISRIVTEIKYIYIKIRQCSVYFESVYQYMPCSRKCAKFVVMLSRWEFIKERF